MHRAHIRYLKHFQATVHGPDAAGFGPGMGTPSSTGRLTRREFQPLICRAKVNWLARMFFQKSPYVYAGGKHPPKILALYSDRFIGEVRIKPYLDALLGRSVIADYQVADRTMTATGPAGPYNFTHIWCQRNISTRQYSFLKNQQHVPVIYDLDDLLTSVPAFVASTKRNALARIQWGLQRAKAVTVASETLKRHVNEDAGSIAGEILVLKNGCVQATPPDRSDRKQLIWTSIDVPFFLRENPTFIEGLANLLRRTSYQLILVGRFDSGVVEALEPSRHIRHLDFASYRGYLRTLSGALAIAPLPSRLPRNAQRYFDAKSDIKLVDYLSSGIIPVFSRAVPYETSDLFLPLLAAADGDEMLAKLEDCIAHRSRMTDHVEETIYRPGLLKRREFTELSKTLDGLFA
jgi:hypothetical protein